MNNNDPVEVDWQNEHLWSEGYRMRVAMLEFIEKLLGLTGISFHFHIYTKTNVVNSSNNPHLIGGIRRTVLNVAIAVRVRAKCRCGHELPGNPNFDDFWYE